VSTHTPEITQDCSKRDSGSFLDENTSYIWFGNHFGSNFYYTGWLLKIDENDVPGTLADIETTILKLTWVNSNANNHYGEFAMLADRSDAFVTGDSPKDDWTAADTENGTVTWDFGGATAGAQVDSPDLSSLLESALAASGGAVSGYYYIALLHKGDSGGSVGTSQLGSRLTVGKEPEFTFDTPTPANHTATPDALNLAFNLPTPNAYEIVTVTYETGYDYDLYLPSGTKPTDGYPVALFVHGGRFVTGDRSIGTSENNLDEEWLMHLLSQNIAVCSMDYHESRERALSGDCLDPTAPVAIKDVHTVNKSLQDSASTESGGDDTYQIDATKVFLAAHSAGTQIALMAAMSHDDTDEYTGLENNNVYAAIVNEFYLGRDGFHYDNTPVVTARGVDYNYNFRPWGGETGDDGAKSTTAFADNPFAGAYMYAPLWDPYGVQDVVTTVSKANAMAWRAHHGLTAIIGNSNLSITTQKYESDPTDYCSPAASGSVHNTARGGQTKRLPDLPIAICYSDDDELITPAYGYTAITDFYTDESLTQGAVKTMSALAPILVTGDVETDGLTIVKHDPAEDILHADVLREAPPEDFVTWLNALLTVPTPDIWYQDSGGLELCAVHGIMEGGVFVSYEWGVDIEFHSEHSNP